MKKKQTWAALYAIHMPYAMYLFFSICRPDMSSARIGSNTKVQVMADTPLPPLCLAPRAMILLIAKHYRTHINCIIFESLDSLCEPMTPITYFKHL